MKLLTGYTIDLKLKKEGLTFELCRLRNDVKAFTDNWPDVVLIPENNFPEYVQKKFEGCTIDNLDWLVIDWEATAKKLKEDYYGVVRYNDQNYFFRP